MATTTSAVPAGNVDLPEVHCPPLAAETPPISRRASDRPRVGIARRERESCAATAFSAGDRSQREPAKLPTNHVTTLTTRAPSPAHQKLVTSKPETSFDASRKVKPLTIR